MHISDIISLSLLLLAPHLTFAKQTCSTQYGPTFKSPIPTQTTTTTLTTTLTASLTIVTKTITSGTLTIPTSNGFTPILSETSTVPPGPPAAQANALKSYPTAIICSTTTTLTVAQTITSAQKHAATTITSTTTTTIPSATFYAACAANNIVDQGEGAGAGHAIEFITFGNHAYNTTEIVNTTAYDCCVACQTTYPCAFASLSTYFGFTPPSPPNCFLYADAGGTCDGGRSFGPAEFYYDPASNATAGEGLVVTNGACGQILYGGAF